jgi:hypothetical protein
MSNPHRAFGGHPSARAHSDQAFHGPYPPPRHTLTRPSVAPRIARGPLRGQARGPAFSARGATEGVWSHMIKASARKRAKPTRERAHTPIMRPGQATTAPSEAMISGSARNPTPGVGKRAHLMIMRPLPAGDRRSGALRAAREAVAELIGDVPTGCWAVSGWWSGPVVPWAGGRGPGGLGEGRSVDLEEVEHGRSEVGFAERGLSSAAGEFGEDLLEVPDRGFDRCAAAHVERCSFGGA